MSNAQPGYKTNVFFVTIPAGTNPPGIVVAQLVLGTSFYVIDSVNVVFPFGVAQVAGFQVVKEGSVLIPWNQNTTFFSGEDESIELPVDYELSGALNILGINQGVINHTLTFRVKWHDVISTDIASVQSSALLPIA